MQSASADGSTESPMILTPFPVEFTYTVLAVEHDKDVISIADEVIDVGPLAGKNGGNIKT